MKNAFDREEQINNKRARTVAGIERLSTIFRSSLQEEVKALGLSPLHGQILLFIATHNKNECNPSVLAQEFAITKPTVSDSIRSLIGKKLITKEQDKRDARAFILSLTSEGKAAVTQLNSLTAYFDQALAEVQEAELDTIWAGLAQLLTQLQKNTKIPARMCTSCAFYQPKTDSGFYCDLLKQALPDSELRIDCPEHRVIN